VLSDFNNSFGIADRNLRQNVNSNMPPHPNSAAALPLPCERNTGVIIDITGTLFD